MQEPFSLPSESKLLKTGWIEIYSVYQVTSIRFPHADDAQIVYDASSETQGAVSRRARRKNLSTFSSVGGRGLPLVLENFRRAFSPGPTGPPRMNSTRLKERLHGTLRSDWQATRFKSSADIAYKCSWEPIRVSHRGGRGTPYNGLHGEALPEKGSFFSLRCKREGVYSFKSRLSLRSKCRSIGRG